MLFKKDKSILGYLSILWGLFTFLFFLEDGKTFQEGLWFYITVSSAASILFSLLYYSLMKDIESNNESTPATDFNNSKEKYTYGYYKSDIRSIVDMYKNAKTPSELKELIEVCDRIIDRTYDINLMGRSSFNGILALGFHDAIKAVQAIRKYANWNIGGLDELRRTVSFSLKYSSDNETIIGLNKLIRTDYQVKLKDIKNTRMSSFMKDKLSKQVIQNTRKQFRVSAAA